MKSSSKKWTQQALVQEAVIKHGTHTKKRKISKWEGVDVKKD